MMCVSFPWSRFTTNGVAASQRALQRSPKARLATARRKRTKSKAHVGAKLRRGNSSVVNLVIPHLGETRTAFAVLFGASRAHREDNGVECGGVRFSPSHTMSFLLPTLFRRPQVRLAADSSPDNQ